MARPVGSSNGRIPEGGYPEIDPEFGGFLAGFIEGEATFAIPKQSTHQNHKCAMSLHARADDGPLIEELHTRTNLGTVHLVPARSTSRPQVRWVVTAKSDCRRLTEILDTYPLRGRKSRAYAIWSGAVDWWVGADPTRREHGRDWTPMTYLKQRLSSLTRYSRSPTEVVDPQTRGLGDDWNPYLAGFVTAEGHFGINLNGSACPRLTVRLRADDIGLLHALRDRSACGRVYGPRTRADGSPTVIWMVFSRQDLFDLVEALDRTPPKGRKLREYELWREAVLVAQRARGAELRDAMARTDRRLKELRRFTLFTTK
jgi:LAGLIDADG endonuclease